MGMDLVLGVVVGIMTVGEMEMVSDLVVVKGMEEHL
jgi:hypothetical protein